MNDIKTILSLVGLVLIVVGYVPYLRDVIKGTTRPHLFSWFIWSVNTFFIYALQVSAGAGVGSWTTLGVAIIPIIILILGFKNGKRDIRKIDVVFLLLALLALPLWLVVDQPVLSILLLMTVDMLGFAPTVRKSWNDPYAETLSMYLITTVRMVLGFFALAEYNIITWLFPAAWAIANALFAIMLIYRRSAIKKTS